jgi:hypothetical protein
MGRTGLSPSLDAAMPTPLGRLARIALGRAIERLIVGWMGRPAMLRES